MTLPKPFKKQFLLLALPLLSACRDSAPPVIQTCVMDGFGGGDCVETDQTHVYRAPSQMQNYFAFSPQDFDTFAAWCYQTSDTNAVQLVLTQIKEKALGNVAPSGTSASPK